MPGAQSLQQLAVRPAHRLIYKEVFPQLQAFASYGSIGRNQEGGGEKKKKIKRRAEFLDRDNCLRALNHLSHFPEVRGQFSKYARDTGQPPAGHAGKESHSSLPGALWVSKQRRQAGSTNSLVL